MRTANLLLIAALGIAPAALAWEGAGAVYLAVAAVHDAPPDLKGLILKYRRDFLAEARDASRRDSSAEEIAAATDAIGGQIYVHRRFSETIPAMGRLLGTIVESADPLADPGAGSLPDAVRKHARTLLDQAAHDPLFYAGVSAATISGDSRTLMRDFLARRSSRLGELQQAGPTEVWARHAASDAVTLATNSLWIIWKRAGGDVRKAKDLDERNGPYPLPGPPR